MIAGAAGGPLAVTEPVVMEVLTGARDGRRHDALRRLLLRFRRIPVEAAVDFEAAALLYRRWSSGRGYPRSLVDCLIAAIALRSNAVLLCRDADLGRIAQVVGLRLDPLPGMSEVSARTGSVARVWHRAP
ncbi:MAG: PIN domain-containing protein [Angustibacter sp.]